MIKDEYKVIILSITAGLFAGFIDSLVGYFVFSEGPFWDHLLLDVPVHELYVRSFLLLSFIVFGVIISRMLSKRRRIEEALKDAVAKIEEEKVKSEAIIAGIGDGISIQDTNFRILYQNQIHKDFIGDHVGDYCYEVYEKRDYVCPECPLAKSFKDGKIHSSVRTAPTDRGISHFEITASPLRDSMGKIIGGIEVVRDVTERKRLEEQLLHAQKMEAIGTLTGGIAHEFNNILTAIIVCVESLRDEIKKESPLRSCLDVISISANKASSLTKSLLTYSRKQATHLEPVNINVITKKVEMLLSGIIGENIHLKTVLSNGDATVMADSGQIEQILLNLATNARDAMPQGGLFSIEIGLSDIDEEFVESQGYGRPGKFAIISVTDTGTGIEERVRDRIFEPFFTTKDVGKGTGLGLSMVYGIVKQHNGYIDVSSEPDKGTTFRIYLPVVRGEIEKMSSQETFTVQGGTETILFAEDDGKVRELLKALLQEYGYNVIEAVDGEDALEKFLQHKDNIDLILFDVVMPNKNGNEVYQEIIKIRPDMKALFLSGYANDRIYEMGFIAESLNYVSKPVSQKQLLRRVREVLNNEKKINGS